MLELITGKYVARYGHISVRGPVFEGDLGLNSENECSSSIERHGFIVPLKPLLRLQDTNGRIIRKVNEIVGLLGSFKGILVTGETASIKEG